MLKLPYGISDFAQVRSEGYTYLDRTHFIPIVEETGKQLLFLRPRRFGKSLWLSTLENYYDVARANQFEQLFGQLAIGQKPTALHNRYLIMKWDFSGIQISSTAAEFRTVLYNHINRAIEDCVARYRDLIHYPVQVNNDDALSSFQSLLTGVQTTPYKLYLFIDEYDNFANDVLMSSVHEGQQRYEELVKGEGIFRTVFKAVKTASAGRGLDRVFITGVSPVVMSDLSSAYNVAIDTYLKPALNTLCGFSQVEVSAMLGEIASACDLSLEKQQEALDMMRTFYNGYCFSPRSDALVYNPTLAFHFLSALQENCLYPDEMLDSNLAMDRNRIRYVAQLGNAERLLTAVLDEQTPLTTATLAQRFGVSYILSVCPKGTEYLASLLYYLGVLTLAGRNDLREYVLRIPNLVVRELYVDQMRQLLLPMMDDQESAQQVGRKFFADQQLQPLCDFVEQRLFRSFDNRDYLAANELTVKTAFLTLLFNDKLYIIDSERAIERSYSDLTLMRRPDLYQNPILYDLLFEFKYVKLSDVKVKQGKQKEKNLDGNSVRRLSTTALKQLPAVQNKLLEANTQLLAYRGKLQAHYGDRLKLRTYAVVGFERLVWEESM